MAGEFCPRCGTARVGQFRYCRACQFDFDALPPSSVAPIAQSFSERYRSAPVPPQAPATTQAAGSNTVAQAAGIAWLLTAAATGYLALLQFGVVGTLFDDGTYQAYAFWNGIAAALTAYFGARCLTNPPRGFLGTSTAWGALSVLSGVYQIANGATNDLFLLATLGAGVAGVLSFAARSAAPVSGK